MALLSLGLGLVGAERRDRFVSALHIGGGGDLDVKGRDGEEKNVWFESKSLVNSVIHAGERTQLTTEVLDLDGARASARQLLGGPFGEGLFVVDMPALSDGRAYKCDTRGVWRLWSAGFQSAVAAVVVLIYYP